MVANMTRALTYFTGVPCPKGHIAERYVSNSVCLDCKKIQYKPSGRRVGNQPCPIREKASANNETFYITDRPCRRGHLAVRHTKTGRCQECYKLTRRLKERQYSLAKYGITPEQYDTMFANQKGLCAICKNPEFNIDHQTKEVRKLAVDHCHETDRIRKLLCSNCNMAIGLLKHDAKLIREAAFYCEEA